MDDTLLFIPPCCVDKKLPAAILQAPRYNLVFYTHGDVTWMDMYKAVAHLVGDGATMVLTARWLSSTSIDYLCMCFERGWINNLVLTLSRPTPLVSMLERHYGRKVLIAVSGQADSAFSHMVLYTKDKVLIINGPMFDDPVKMFHTVSYSATLYANRDVFTKADWGNPLRNILLPVTLIHRKAHTKEELLTSKTMALYDFYMANFGSNNTTDEQQTRDNR